MPAQGRYLTAHDGHPKMFAYQSPPQQTPRGDDYPAIAAPSIGRDQLIRNTHRPESILRADGASLIPPTLGFRWLITGSTSLVRY
jgi:hypothetical protein